VSDPAGTGRALRRIGRIRQTPMGPLVYTPPPVLPVYYHPWSHAVNRRLLLWYLRTTLLRLVWEPEIVWTYWPHTGDVIAGLDASLSVYHCIDDFTAVEYPLTPRGTIGRLEADQCRKVDLIFARTETVADAKRRINANTYLLSGGVDTADFDPDAISIDPRIDALPAPRVGFLGTMDDRLDVDLLKNAIERLPDVTFVFVGPVKRHLVDLRSLRNMPNVQFFPACPYSEAPALVSGFDVCLIPYRKTPFTSAVSPIKLYEYLAMGKPVVATDLPYHRREAASIRLASTPVEFVSAVVSALRQPLSAEDRRRFRAVAQFHSWERQADEIERHLMQHLKENA
jgi:glycosyltransferase involved in cell wall biosynthesis